MRFEAQDPRAAARQAITPRSIDYGAAGPEAAARRADARTLSTAAVRAGRERSRRTGSYPVEGMDGGSVSMLAVQFG